MTTEQTRFEMDADKWEEHEAWVSQRRSLMGEAFD
jgi:hypothetical protein